MTGWGDESYDAAAAGGWNDTSFGASDQGAGQFRTDKIPFPATVKDLSTLATSEEKLVVGKSVFTTVSFSAILFFSPPLSLVEAFTTNFHYFF